MRQPRLARRNFCALLGAVLLAGCTPPDISGAMRDSEGEVITGFLDHLPVEAGKRVVVAPVSEPLQETHFGRWEDEQAERVRTQLPGASRTVIADFVRAGNTSVPLRLPARLILPAPGAGRFAFAEPGQLERIFGAHQALPWQAFHKEFPGATWLLRISRAGIDVLGGQALLYVSGTCGGLCGSGKLCLLRPRDGEWRVAEERTVWVA